MSLTRYLYTGPQSAACLRIGESAELLDVQLLPGHPVELPAEHDYTLVLVALKHLVPAPVETAATPNAPATDSPPPVEKKGAKSNAS